MSCFPCLSSRPKEDIRKVNSKKVVSDIDGPRPGLPMGAKRFTMTELSKATGNFSSSQKIGQGGFGTVYQGKLQDGTVVAVKRAKKDAFETRVSREFQNEFDMLSQVEHLNLVRLIGYLEEPNERILVTEYVSNGNLRQHLDGKCVPFRANLDMNRRLDIAIDIAHALTYLHYYADKPIIHRDVKSSNILITETYRAKVADFGFARIGPTGNAGATHVSTQVKGTAGYLDPEYLTTYQLNVKSDVYSFGVMLIELFTGRRPIELSRPSAERVTVRWAFKHAGGKVKWILDPKIEKTAAVLVVVERLFELAFCCSAPTKVDRPSMKEAQEVLWNIRKDYQAAEYQERGTAAEAGNLQPKDSHRTRGGQVPQASRHGGEESESVQARSSRRSEESSRNPSSQGSHDYSSNWGSYDKPESVRSTKRLDDSLGNRGCHENPESMQSTQWLDESVALPYGGTLESIDFGHNIPSVAPISVPNYRSSDRQQNLQ